MDVEQRILIIHFEKKKPSFRRKECVSKRAQELRAMGAMLYWTEGYKTKKSNGIDFANSDPDMIKVFVDFLRSTYELDESRFRAYVYCHSDQDIEAVETFWSKLTNIPRSQFTKPYVRSDFRKRGRKMQYGLLHVRYADKKLLRDILNLIESYKHSLLEGRK